MKTPTIKDIARESGVSHGTVSNVLNGRGNVSLEKIRLVEEAANRLGYRINAKARVLRKGSSNTILFIVPNTDFEQYVNMYQELQKRARAIGHDVFLYCTGSIKSEEEAAIEYALMSRAAAIIAVIHLDAENPRLKMAFGNTPVVLVDNHLPVSDSVLLAGFSYAQAGKDIADYLNRKNAGRIAVFTASLDSSNICDFTQSLLDTFDGEGDYFCSADQLISVGAFELFAEDTHYDYIVCTSTCRQKAVEAAHSYAGKSKLPPIITVAERNAISNSNTLVYELDYKQLAHSIFDRIFENDSGQSDSLILPNHGFKHFSGVSLPVKPEKLRFLTVNSPASVALSRLLPQLKQKTGIDVELTVTGHEDIYRIAQDETAHSFDLIRMDMAWISELAPKVYAPLHTLAYDWGKITSKILPIFLQDYTTTRNTAYCLPYDPSTQLFFYRKDLFEDPVVKRMYYEMNRSQLSVPKTFAEYNEVARFFTRAYNPHSPVLYGTTSAIGTAEVNPSEYLPRLFGENGSLFDENGHLHLTSSFALHALNNYIESFSYSDLSVHNWWEDALLNFSRGDTAMTIVFMNYAADLVKSHSAKIVGQIGFSMVPGEKPLVGGGVVGICKNSRKAAQAYTFLSWLYSDEIAPAFTMLGGLSPCATVYSSHDVLELYPWLSAAKHSFPIGQRRLHNNRYTNFSEKRLESMLGVYVKKAILGEIPPKLALELAQQACEKEFILK